MRRARRRGASCRSRPRRSRARGRSRRRRRARPPRGAGAASRAGRPTSRRATARAGRGAARGRGRIERVPGEQALVQRPHRRAGRRPELLAQQDAHRLVGGQRLRDLATRGQRLHQQPVAGLAQRRRAHELARRALGAVHVCAAEREPGLGQPLERPQPEASSARAGAPRPMARRGRAGSRAPRSPTATVAASQGRRPVTVRDRHRARSAASRARSTSTTAPSGSASDSSRRPDQDVTPDRLADLRQQRAQRLVGIGGRRLRHSAPDPAHRAETGRSRLTIPAPPARADPDGPAAVDPLAAERDLQPPQSRIRESRAHATPARTHFCSRGQPTSEGCGCPQSRRARLGRHRRRGMRPAR